MLNAPRHITLTIESALASIDQGRIADARGTIEGLAKLIEQHNPGIMINTRAPSKVN